MSQEFYDLDVNNNLNLEIPKMNKSIKAAASDFAGKAFPAAPFVGMTCYREDLNISYKYNGTAWMVENDYNRSPYVVTVTFTANDERWTELIEGESYALTIPRGTKTFLDCYNSNGERVLVDSVESGTNLTINCMAKFAGYVKLIE